MPPAVFDTDGKTRCAGVCERHSEPELGRRARVRYIDERAVDKQKRVTELPIHCRPAGLNDLVEAKATTPRTVHGR